MSTKPTPLHPVRAFVALLGRTLPSRQTAVVFVTEPRDMPACAASVLLCGCHRQTRRGLAR